MSSRILSNIRSTAAWRISVWATVAFAIGTAVAFSLMYWMVARGIEERSDAWLAGEAQVLADVASNTPQDRLYDRLVGEVAELATREVYDPEISAADMRDSVFFVQERPGHDPIWVGPDPRAPFLRAIADSQISSAQPSTMLVEGRKHPFRVVLQVRGDSRIYLGYSDLAGLALMGRLTQRFALIFVGMVLLGFFIAFGGAFRTLQRVERITETVASIRTEDLSSRLPESSSRDEIERLSATFNRMLDRIQASVKQMRVLTDSLAHDLKSPVTSIRGCLEVALSTDGTWRDAVADAIDKLDGMSQMLNTSLDVAEANAGALPLRREALDFSAMVAHMADLYAPAFAERRHNLRLEVAPHLTINADAGLVGRAVSNLLDNEVAHLPEGAEVRIRLARNDGMAALTVEDGGPGLAPELLERAFQQFAKGSASKGHGLGLAFVQAVARAHGGSVSLVNLKPAGLCVIFSLPTTERVAAEHDSLIAATSAQRP
jgi:signal transduction histidine kinase